MLWKFLGNRLRSPRRPAYRSRPPLLVEQLEERRLLDGNGLLTSGPQITRPVQFGSAAAFIQYLRDSALDRYKDLFGTHFASYNFVPVPGPVVDSSVPVGFGGGFTAAQTVNSNSFSQTNIQVPGVDEADIVKNDGNYIYLISRQELVIAQAGPGNTLHIASRAAVEGTVIAEYLNGDRVTVLSTIYASQPIHVDPLVRSADGFPLVYPGSSKVKVTVFDVSNRAAPKEVKDTYLDGTYLDSRAIGNQVYVVAQNYFTGLPAPAYTTFNGESIYESKDQYLARITGHELDLSLPHFYTHAGRADNPLQPAGFVIDPAHIYKPLSTNDYNLVSVLDFDVTSTSPGPVDTASILGTYGTTVYASMDHLYVVLPNWTNTASSSSSSSTILQFQLNAGHVDLAAVGAVPGQVLNQFSLDEQGQYLRIATTSNWGPGATNNLYVLANEAGTLQRVGSLEGLAPGQQLRSTRFVGDHAFLVTYQQIDPLFALDLSDPSAPRVVGQLHLPGSSSYLQPIDATHLLGIGRDASGAALDLSLFDTSNLNAPRLVSQYVVAPPNWNWWWGSGSEAEWDHHALGYFSEFHTLAIPVYGSYTSLNYTGYQSSLWVFQVDVTTGFHLLGQINQDSQVRRSVRIGDRLYSLADDSLAVRPIQDPSAAGAEVRIHDDPRFPDYSLITLTKNQAFSGQLLSFKVSDATGLTAGINWGDGQTSDGVITPDDDGDGRYVVTGTHTYTQAGYYYPVTTFSRAGQTLDTLYASVKVFEIEVSHQQFLARVYQDLLHRELDPVGLVGWGGQLQAGTPNAAVVTQIASSTEYRTLVIQDVYHEFLGRAAEDAGLASWLDYLAAGHSTNELRAGILGSAEYLVHQGNGAFLQSLYEDVLHRALDATGARIWEQLLALGTPRAAVALAVLHSPEAQTNTVRGLYTQYLHRDSEEAGLGVFVAALQHGNQQEEVLADILGSAEYADRL
jgi:inhibitor of cysteine peptidase